jgi:flagellar biosynthetic protein FliR
VIIGFFLLVVFSAFQLSAQFFSLQMGFGASEVFDPLAQVEIPVMGQFLNLIAMFIFLTVGGFSKLFLIGVRQSFTALTAAQLVGSREFVFGLFMNSLGQLFEQAMVISFPIFGSMFLVQITLGLLAKAAPQMNLLTLGFPISTTIAFLVLFMTLPFVVEAFATIIDAAFERLLQALAAVWRGSA